MFKRLVQRRRSRFETSTDLSFAAHGPVEMESGMFKVVEKTRDAGPVGGYLELPFHMRQRSRLKTQLVDGREVILQLPRGGILRNGDRLVCEDGFIVEVRAAPEPISTVYATDPYLLARACYHLGNRHVAVQIGAGFLRYEQDHVLDSMVTQLGLTVLREVAPFEPEAGAYHAHQH